MKKRNLFAAILACAPGCASFGHGVWDNREEVFARLDSVETKWEEAGGRLAGMAISPVIATANSLLFLLFAGLSGGAHAIEAPLDALGLTKCEGCEREHQALTTRPSKP